MVKTTDQKKVIKKKILPPEIYREIETTLKKCYSCNKCISGCPVVQEMDFPPSVLVKWLIFGEIDKVIKSKTIWICSSCYNCYSRCPFEINIPHIIDLLKEYSYKNKLTRKERSIRLFHQTFLSAIKDFGRIHEASLIGKWKIRSGNWFSDLSLGLKMFLKHKLNLFPEKVKHRKEIKKLFKSLKSRR